jgi:hypothetical protein
MRGGRKQDRLFCQAMTRRGTHCYAKGFATKNGKMLCRFHGYQNVDGFKKPNYTIESKIKQLKGLIQFKDKTDEEIKKHIEEVITPRIERGTSEYHRKQIVRRDNPRGNLRRKKLTDQIDRIISLMQKKS